MGTVSPKEAQALAQSHTDGVKQSRFQVFKRSLHFLWGTDWEGGDKMRGGEGKGEEAAEVVQVGEQDGVGRGGVGRGGAASGKFWR